MRSGLLLVLVAVMIGAGCQSVRNQTADSASAESAVFSSREKDVSGALAAYLQGQLLEREAGTSTQEAANAYQRALALRPDLHIIYARLAAHAFNHQQPEQAIALLQTSLAADPTDYMRHLDLASMYLLTGQNQQAIQSYRTLLELTPPDTHTQATATIHIALASLLFEASEDAEALDVLEQGIATADEPDRLKAFLHQTARRFVLREEWDRARACYTRLAAWDQDEAAEIQYLIAELYIAEDRLPEAQQALLLATSLPNAPAGAFLQLGALLIDANAPSEARAVLQEGASRFPEQASFPFALGSIHTREEQYAKALEHYRQAVDQALAAEKDPSSEEARIVPEGMLIALAATQDKTGDMEAAETTLRMALDRYPQSHIAMNFLAYMWAEAARNLEEAYTLSRTSLELEPNNAAYLDTLGWIYYQKKQYEKALDYLQQAHNILGDDPEITLHLGDVYHAMGNTETAVQYWRQSAEADPASTNRARQRLAAVEATPAEPPDPSGQPPATNATIHAGQSATNRPHCHTAPEEPNDTDPQPPQSTPPREDS